MKLIPFICLMALFISLSDSIVVPGKRPQQQKRAVQRQQPTKVYRRQNTRYVKRSSNGPIKRQLRASVNKTNYRRARKANDGDFSLDEPGVGEGEGPGDTPPPEFDEDYSFITDSNIDENPYGEKDPTSENDVVLTPDQRGPDGKSKFKIPWFGTNHPIYEISFAELTEREHLENFKKISADLKLYEDEYMDCIKGIHETKYSQSRIDECVGPNFIKVLLDIKYETMRVISKADSRIKHFFLEKCYKRAGFDEQFARACDLFEKDVLDLMWNGFDFVKLPEINKLKYIYDYATLDQSTFKEILSQLEPIKNEFFELFNEIFAHKQVTMLRLKTLIDDRTKVIVAEAKRNPALIAPKIISHNIEIEETVDGPDFEMYKNLPKQQIGGQDPSKFSIDLHDAFDRKLDDKKNRDIPNKERLLNHGDNYHGLNAYSRPPTFNRYQLVKRTNKGVAGLMNPRGMVNPVNDIKVHGGTFMKEAMRKRGY